MRPIIAATRAALLAVGLWFALPSADTAAFASPKQCCCRGPIYHFVANDTCTTPWACAPTPTCPSGTWNDSWTPAGCLDGEIPCSTVPQMAPTTTYTCQLADDGTTDCWGWAPRLRCELSVLQVDQTPIDHCANPAEACSTPPPVLPCGPGGGDD